MQETNTQEILDAFHRRRTKVATDLFRDPRASASRVPGLKACIPKTTNLLSCNTKVVRRDAKFLAFAS